MFSASGFKPACTSNLFHSSTVTLPEPQRRRDSEVSVAMFSPSSLPFAGKVFPNRLIFPGIEKRRILVMG